MSFVIAYLAAGGATLAAVLVAHVRHVRRVRGASGAGANREGGAEADEKMKEASDAIARLVKS